MDPAMSKVRQSEVKILEQGMFTAWRTDIDLLTRAYIDVSTLPCPSSITDEPASAVQNDELDGEEDDQLPTTSGGRQPQSDYERFHSLFVSRDVHKLFSGRLSVTELMEFSEHVLQYAAGYMFEHMSVPRELLQRYEIRNRDRKDAAASSDDGEDGMVGWVDFSKMTLLKF